MGNEEYIANKDSVQWDKEEERGQLPTTNGEILLRRITELSSKQVRILAVRKGGLSIYCESGTF